MCRYAVTNEPPGRDVVVKVQVAGSKGCVMIDNNTINEGNVVIRVVASDPTYSTYAYISYTLY